MAIESRIHRRFGRHPCVCLGLGGERGAGIGQHELHHYRAPPPEQETPPPTDEACSGGGYNPTPTAIEVGAVPIVVESTTEEYFVLYVRHDLDGTVLELPVSVTLGENGTSTLAENVEALPKERYLVEKFLIADPADVDGDCIDDITELGDPAGMNPVNPAAGIELSDGAVAVPGSGSIRDALQ